MEDRLETTIDDIIDLVLSDQNVEQLNHDHAPVSPETWLAVKAHLLALLAETMGEEQKTVGGNSGNLLDQA